MLTRDLQKEEAVERMKYLGVNSEAIAIFQEADTPCVSDGGFLTIPGPSIEQKVKEFEKDTNSVVYHVILSDMVFPDGESNEVASFLFVSNSPEEWEYDREDLTCGCPVAYVWNITVEPFSEFGSIGIRPFNGGFLRNDRGYDFASENRTMADINPAVLEEEEVER